MTFDYFQKINAKRCDSIFHPIKDWLPTGWPLAICGEAGELANIMKKVIRGDFTLEEKREEILKELADIITYSDLMISALGANTGEEVLKKFDEVSNRRNYIREK